MASASQLNRTSREERPIARIKLDPIGSELGSPDLDSNIAFSNADFGSIVGELAIGSNVQALASAGFIR